MSTVQPTIRLTMKPRKTLWGRGSISALQNVPGRRALIITDTVLVELGTVSTAESYLKKAGLEVKVFDEVINEPSIDLVMRIVERHKDFNPDVIIGLGGGSSMDASKAFRVFLEHPQLTFEEVSNVNGPPTKTIPLFTKTLSVAVPSTSGTGSEATFGAVISDPETNVKCVLRSEELMPNIAILDVDIADSMPVSVRAETGLDALTHAINSSITLIANDFSRASSLQATRSLMKYLIPSCLQGDKDAREHVHYAASLAGDAIAGGGVGLDHAVAHIFGTNFHLPHGRACGIVLPYAIKFHGTEPSVSFEELARAVGYNGSNRSEAVDYLVDKVIELNRQLGIPGSYSEAGVSEDAYRAGLPQFIDETLAGYQAGYSARKCTAENIKELYDASYYGKYL
ncbi:iron-containing alcohol dehydrogenase [Chloroflexota bacterium]